jgi:uncharacterized protein with ParB-like and HNH nuclease domain
MKAEPLDFLGLIGGQKIFKIPVFQRPYSWEKDEREALWLDILAQYSKLLPHWQNADRDAIIKKIPKHYMGTMVLSGEGAVGIPIFEIIDGQQRVTTIMAMVAALRDAKIKKLPKDGRKEAAERIRNKLNNTYLVNAEANEEERLRLRLQNKDSRAFGAIIEHDGMSKLSKDGIGLQQEESDYVIKTYHYFLKQFLREPVAEEEIAETNVEIQRFNRLFPLNLDVLEQVIVRRLSFISILGSSEIDDLNSIFESLNAKGKGLEELDLLKNYIFMLLGSRAGDAITRYWSRIERALPDRDEQEFFVWASMVSDGNYEMQNRLYREIKTQLQGQGASSDKEVVIRYLERLTRKIAHYVNFTRKMHDNPQIKAAFERLRHAGDKIATPVVLWLYGLRSEDEFNDAEFLRGCKVVEAFLVRRFLAGEASNNLNSMFGRALDAVHKDVSDVPYVDKLISALSEWYPSDDAVIEGTKTKPFYGFGKSEQRIFILGALDRTYDEKSVRDIQESDKSIEHIFPQTTTSEWDSAFINDQEEYQRIRDGMLDTLGNLTVVLPGENSEVKNKLLADKVVKYANFEYAMTRSIPSFVVQLGATRWGKREIHARAEILAKKALVIWPDYRPRG